MGGGGCASRRWGAHFQSLVSLRKSLGCNAAAWSCAQDNADSTTRRRQSFELAREKSLQAKPLDHSVALAMVHGAVVSVDRRQCPAHWGGDFEGYVVMRRRHFGLRACWFVANWCVTNGDRGR